MTHENVKRDTRRIVFSLCSRAAACFALSVTLFLAGCGGGNEVTLVPVTGLIYKGSKPAVNALVEFIPQTGRSSFARTDEEGQFEMMYGLGKPGVPPGSYTVSIQTPEPKDKPESEDKETVPGGGRNIGFQEAAAVPFVAEDHEYLLETPILITEDDPPAPFEWDLDVIGTK